MGELVVGRVYTFDSRSIIDFHQIVMSMWRTLLTAMPQEMAEFLKICFLAGGWYDISVLCQVLYSQASLA